MTVIDTTPDVDTPLVPSTASAVWGELDNVGLICRQVQEITHDVKTFLFEPSQPAVFAHQPGQFVTLQLQIEGQPVSRCYTISTPPTRPHLLGITVKRQPGGLVSNWLHDTITPGTRVSADGPFGVFTLPNRERAKYLFLSGGSGVTPLMSMTRSLFDLGSDADVVFVHSARTPADIIFRRELDAIAAAAPNIAVFHVCEQNSPGEPWGGLRGRLSLPVLQHLVPDLTDREIYCCGPTPYMNATRRMLIEGGCVVENYHQESFSFEELPMQAFAADDSADPLAGGSLNGASPSQTSVATFTVEFTRSGRTFPCAADQNVLDAAYAAGLNPMSSCTQGMCGTCKTSVLAGSVDMNHNGGIRPREIAANKVLICCSKPLSDLSLDA